MTPQGCDVMLPFPEAANVILQRFAFAMGVNHITTYVPISLSQYSSVLTQSGWGTGCLVMMIYAGDCMVADF